MKIVVCLTGSVAVIEAPKLVRELARQGHEVHCVMSDAAQKLISPDVLEWASDRPVITKLTGKVEHVKLAGLHKDKADLVLVAPSTANTISKIAAAIDDTPVTTVVTTAIGSKTPVIIIPAMHLSMYQHPILKENMLKLKKHEVHFILPRIAENKAKFPDIKTILDKINFVTSRKDLAGKRILVTAGSTIEDIDEVRYIANRSSGKMGIAIANEAHCRGAEVVLIRGMTTVEPKYDYVDIKVRSVEDMLNAIEQNINADVIIHSAAVSDFSVDKKAGKIPSEQGFSLKLKPNIKIIDEIKKLNNNIFVVGFKAEYNLSQTQIIDKAFSKLVVSNADLIVANDVSKNDVGFNSDTNEVTVVDASKNTKKFKLAHKKVIANQILDLIL